jgi:spermidine synthase
VSRRQDPAQLVGGLYAANTVGAVAGALATSLILVASLGSRLTEQVLILVSACAGLSMLAPSISWQRPSRAIAAAAAIVGAVVLAYAVPELPREFVAFGRFTPTRGVGADVVYVGEGLSASVAVSEEGDGTRTFHSAGKAQASSHPQDMRLQRMLGHLTTLVADTPQSFLVIGLGAGITAGAVGIEPAAEHVVIAEIEPLVADVASAYFREQNFDVMSNRKVEIHFDDGRHYLATTEETFDGITTDPLDPWVKGAAALYTREFWELVDAHLNPGGVVTAYVQFFETTEEAVKSEVATFFDVFPDGAVFANTVQGMGYDAVLLARAGALPIDVDRIEERMRSPEYQPVLESLRQVGFRSAIDLLGTYAGHASDLSPWLEGAPINRDRNLRLQYLAGRGLNVYEADGIFDDMMSGAREPHEELFIGRPERLEQLRQAVRVQRERF